jgi:hypothetical protein
VRPQYRVALMQSRIRSRIGSSLWDLLPQQVELTLKLLQQSALNPWISAWEFFHGPFDFNKFPLIPVGFSDLINAKPANQPLWEFCAKQGFYIGPALDSYCSFKLVKSDTKSQVTSDTVEFRTPTSLSRLPLQKIRLSMACRLCQAPLQMPLHQRASPRWKPLPICRIFLNHGASLVHLLLDSPASQPQAVQG